MWFETFCVLCQHFEFADPLWQNLVRDMLQDICGHCASLVWADEWISCGFSVLWSVFAIPMWDYNKHPLLGGWRSMVEESYLSLSLVVLLFSHKTIVSTELVGLKNSFDRFVFIIPEPRTLPNDRSSSADEPRGKRSDKSRAKLCHSAVGAASWMALSQWNQLSSGPGILWVALLQSTPFPSSLHRWGMVQSLKRWQAQARAQMGWIMLVMFQDVSCIVLDQGISRRNIWTLLLP